MVEKGVESPFSFIHPPSNPQGESCCGYGATGMKTLGYDCVSIPGGFGATTAVGKIPTHVCGRSKGLVSMTGTVSSSVCCE